MDHADGARQHFIALFSEALSAFRAREWDRAEQLFQEYLNLSEEDGAARHYLRECAKCREYPPDEDWDGMVCFEKK
ncbi:MAG: hypothetical protein HGB17_15865 [Syntrophobacteraceae bacterium]|nr:hypothetical protein [Syntrophobacteraceae bacterium]